MTDYETHITNEQYNSGVKLEDWKGTFSLAAVYVNQSGETKLRWCYPAKNDKPGDKLMPVKLTLGDRQRACELLVGLLAEIDPSFAMPAPATRVQDEALPEEGGDIPF